MRLTREVRLGDDSVTVHELTVAEIDAWWAELQREVQGTPQAAEPRELDVVAARLMGDLTFGDLRRLSSVTDAQLRAATQSELAALAAEAKALNPLFFALRLEVGGMLGMLMLRQAAGAPNLPAPPVH